jgi:hypothetical protein
VDLQLLSPREQQPNMVGSTKSADETSADDDKIKSDLFNLVENLRIELQKKDQELNLKDKKLAKEKQQKKVCIFNYCLQIST